MVNTKLIMVEGIPGSGKSTTAYRIKSYLDSIKIPSRLYLESDCSNPSDYAWVSVISFDEYAEFIKEYPEYKYILEQYSEIAGEDILIYYQKMKSESDTFLPDGMINFLSAHEPYDGKVSINRFMELHLNRYRQFSENAITLKEINIFESCYLQNQVNELLGFHNLDNDIIIQHLCSLAQTLKDLNPVLIYLTQPDVFKTISRVADERRSRDKDKYSDWIDHVIKYVSGSPYGMKNNLRGFDGVVEYFLRRKEVELEAINHIDMKTIIIENLDYDAEKGITRVIETISNLWEA